MHFLGARKIHRTATELRPLAKIVDLCVPQLGAFEPGQHFSSANGVTHILEYFVNDARRARDNVRDPICVEHDLSGQAYLGRQASWPRDRDLHAKPLPLLFAKLDDRFLARVVMSRVVVMTIRVFMFAMVT